MDLKQKLKTSLQENYYIVPSYQTYGGSSGFHDFGVLGKKMKNNLINAWRENFINDPTDTIVEIETPTIMPYNILYSSGHVQRFTDFIVYDIDNNCYRADHLAKKWFKDNNMSSLADKVDTWNKDVLQENINKYKMIKTKDDLAEVLTKNLMFEVPSTSNNFGIDFLRPELAQGIFVSYGNCQKFLNKEPPFGISQTGSSYRKEISPQPFTRMREFSQAEIEYFFDPKNKTHHNFEKYKDTIIPILTGNMQLNNESIITVTVEEAIKRNLISSPLMAYFLARIYIFAMSIGLNKVRFRQHLPHEMSHYAVECWDLETFVNSDWLECVGCADRGDYDLKSHNNVSVPKVHAKRELQVPMEISKLSAKLNMKMIGQIYGKNTVLIQNYFANLSQDELEKIANKTVIEFTDPNTNTEYKLDSSLIEIVKESYKNTHETYVPHVLEPSFGIDRLMYSILEQNFWLRPDSEQRLVLSLPNILSPYSVAIYPLSKNVKFNPIIDNLEKILDKNKLSYHKDNSSTTIGKRYTRADEMGIKYVITVDFDSFNDNKVTIRERDSMSQIRVPIDDNICQHLK